MVRPYVAVGGRTSVDGSQELEITTPLVPVEQAGWRMPIDPQSYAIWKLCRDSVLSPVDVAAKMRLPIGTVRVVLADMIASGFLIAGSSAFDMDKGSLEFMSRVLAGLRRL
ncbi:hypothetical protein GCM10011609_84790 [Lentzea pudingi]|uniref:DUF742 domain-containing protein n=1 Tax=Lentzea pudingi TaxID=1789439 RepID=A0ABQ2IVN1_9PSEU|nr:DUF742 domain-containing protein [Lentzea pudingi]GGN28577.1 hypothetical protein GCM10011609_84790 [Lentzea pudingi]